MSILRPRPHARGFTLVEILVTIVIVGLLAAMATPSFVEKMRDRRASQVASEVGLIYRTAKARAAGRGGAQLVRYSNATSPQGDFFLMEAVQPDTQGNAATGATFAQMGSCGNLPLVASCLSAQWNTAVAGVNVNATARIVTQVPERSTVNATIYATFKAPGNGAVLPQADICFTPGGRTYFASGGSPFTALNSIPTVQVQRFTLPSGGTAVGVLRTVLLPPNGAARQVL